MSYRLKSNSVYHELAEINDISNLTVTGKCYSSTMDIVLWKFANIVECSILWNAAVSDTNKVVILSDVSIPSGWRPRQQVYCETRSFASGQVINNSVTRYQIDTDGSISIITNESGFVERRITTSWIT